MEGVSLEMLSAFIKVNASNNPVKVSEQNANTNTNSFANVLMQISGGENQKVSLMSNTNTDENILMQDIITEESIILEDLMSLLGDSNVKMEDLNPQILEELLKTLKSQGTLNKEQILTDSDHLELNKSGEEETDEITLVENTPLQQLMMQMNALVNVNVLEDEVEVVKDVEGLKQQIDKPILNDNNVSTFENVLPSEKNSVEVGSTPILNPAQKEMAMLYESIQQDAKTNLNINQLTQFEKALTTLTMTTDFKVNSVDIPMTILPTESKQVIEENAKQVEATNDSIPQVVKATIEASTTTAQAAKVSEEEKSLVKTLETKQETDVDKPVSKEAKIASEMTYEQTNSANLNNKATFTSTTNGVEEKVNSEFSNKELQNFDIIKQVNTKLSEQLDKANQEFVIKLKPEGLGEIVVKMVSNNGNIEVNLITNNLQTKNYLNEQMVNLKANLQQINTEVKEVIYDNQSHYFSENNFSDSQGHFANQRNQQNRYYDYQNSNEMKEEEINKNIELLISNNRYAMHI